MLWIYLSPHFDDVALSCGGLVWEQVQAGDSVSIWTVCSGNAPGGELSPFAEELLLRWEADQDATAQRRLEDIHSCQRLGSDNCYFGIPDCIYRRHPQTGEFLYASETALTGSLQPADTQSIMSLREDLKRSIQPDMVLVCPLGLGNHVDHQFTRLAAEGLDCTLWYYADYPYVLRCTEQLDKMEQDGWSRQIFPISLKGLIAWQDSIAAHGSQISTFWSNETEMRQAIVDYLSWNHGIQLWRKSGP